MQGAGGGRVRLQRYPIVRLLTGLVLLTILIPLTTLLIGNLASIMPTGLAIGFSVIALLCVAVFGSRPVADKLSKR
jgi:uncharacterized RDD family membrane protein YckC